MQPQPSASPTIRNERTQRLLIAAAALAYVLAVGGGITPVLGATALSALAIAALGAALFVYVATRVKPQAAVRLGGRAQAARRRYRAVALVALSVVYLTLVAGVLVANENALRACLALPLCSIAHGNSASRSQALIAIGHRVLAALAALLVVELGYRTWRLRTERIVRRAVLWALALMVVQILIGMAQIALALEGANAPLSAVRAAHLAIGVGAWAALVVQIGLALYLPLPVVRGPPSVATDNGQRTMDTGQRTARAILRDYVSLTKPGVITLLIFTTIASMYITPAGAPPLALVFWTFVGGWLMASGAHAINCWADRDIDINMGRTSRRPIPSGRIPAWHALALGIALGALAFAILATLVNLPAALLALAGYCYYVFVYTRWLKRTTPSNIVIGGGAGAFPPLVGWAAATGGLTLPSLFLFAIIFYWTPPHFWALALIREQDYARASVPMLPVVAGDTETKREILLYTLLMLALTVMPTPLYMLGIPYLLMAMALGAVFLGYVIRLWRTGSTASAWGLYKFSLLYLFLLFTAMVIDRM
jgi:protoheme IX farnesyltransferase